MGLMARPPRIARPAQRRRRGFTLVEIMMIVTVIGIMSAIAIPSIHGALAERMARDSGSELILLGRRARAESAAYGRAHVLRWSNAGNGTFNVYRGRASSCNANTWAVHTASNCQAANPGYCVEELLATSYVLGSTDVMMAESTGRAALDLCFEPSGRVLWRNAPGTPFTDANTVGGGFRFTFQRRESGTAVGVQRTILIPLGGDARELR